MTETNQTARERIRDVVYEAMDYVDTRHGYERPGEWDRREDVATDRIIAIVREALIPSLSKYAYEQTTPVILSELDGSPTWEEACERQHSITVYISHDIYKLINAVFGEMQEEP